MTTQINAALIIPTRNRADEIDKTLNVLTSFTQLPRTIVVVDSSEDNATELIVSCLNSANQGLEIVYLRSALGAPHQKNTALDYLLGSTDREYDFVSFLDDDVEPFPSFFLETARLFDKFPDYVCIGGFDTALRSLRFPRLRTLLGIHVDSGGVIMKSGLAIVPRVNRDLQVIDWTPGGMQSIKWSVIAALRFDGVVRIHGDEVELQMRLREFGAIGASARLPVKHRSARGGKQNERKTIAYLDGFRWRLARQFPDRVKWRMVLSTSIKLAFLELLAGIASFRPLHFSRALGHLDFLRLALNKQETQDLVAHEGSGPHVSTEGWAPWSQS